MTLLSFTLPNDCGAKLTLGTSKNRSQRHSIVYLNCYFKKRIYLASISETVLRLYRLMLYWLRPLVFTEASYRKQVIYRHIFVLHLTFLVFIIPPKKLLRPLIVFIQWVVQKILNDFFFINFPTLLNIIPDHKNLFFPFSPSLSLDFPFVRHSGLICTSWIHRRYNFALLNRLPKYGGRDYAGNVRCSSFIRYSLDGDDDDGGDPFGNPKPQPKEQSQKSPFTFPCLFSHTNLTLLIPVLVFPDQSSTD